LEHLLRPERLDQIFEKNRQRQYVKHLLFSQIVAVMVAVATRVHKSVHAAYLDSQEQLGVSVTALYDKLNHLEPETSAALVRETAADAARVIDTMPTARKSILPGLEVFYLDGNHLAPPNTAWPNCAAPGKDRCRGNPWRCWTRSAS